jgi:prepilin-type N-terminal cleavage/methylation domain-containing protein
MTASQQNTTSVKGQYKHAARNAFTLIELLVVIALTSILLTLVFVPLTNSLNLTSRAGTQIEAQSAARDIMRQIQAELSGPVFVYDNASQGVDALGGQGRLDDPDGRIYFWAYGQPATGTNAIGGPAVPELLRYAMVEFVQPASQSEQSPSTLTDPTTGKPLQTPNAPTNMSLPLVMGRTIERYFVGVRDNTSGPTTLTDLRGNTLSGMPVSSSGAFHGYANRYDDAGDVNIQADNRATLYKAEVQPFVIDTATSKYGVNVGLFHTLNDDGTKGSDPTKPIILDDPNFFYDTTLVASRFAAPGVNVNGRAAVPMWENWKAVSQSLLALNKADAITLERDDRNGILYRDSEGRLPTDAGATAPFLPVIRPLITFTPQYVENDPGVPSSLENAGAESPYSAATQFRSQYGAWARPFRVVVYRAPDTQTDPLNYVDPATKKPLTYEMEDPNIGITFQGTPGNVGPAPDASGFWTNKNPQYAFTVDYEKGTVNFAFPHWVLDKDASGNPVPMFYNPNTVNSKIDVLLANGDAQYAKRFLWMRDFDINNTANPAGAISPLKQYDVLNDTPPSFYRVRVVPGSERIFGPDQNPGPHYGYRTQYTRVSANVGSIGHNQYKILYENAPNAANTADAADPRVRTGFVEFDSLPDTNGIDIGSQNIDPTDDIPMTHLKNVNGNQVPVPPTYRNHSLPEKKWVPDPTAPTDTTKGTVVDADPVEVSYSFQMNRPTDVVKIDYLTRSIMNVNMEMRLYDPRSARPQTTQLVDKVTVRNLPR